MNKAPQISHCILKRWCKNVISTSRLYLIQYSAVLTIQQQIKRLAPSRVRFRTVYESSQMAFYWKETTRAIECSKIDHGSAIGSWIFLKRNNVTSGAIRYICMRPGSLWFSGVDSGNRELLGWGRRLRRSRISDFPEVQQDLKARQHAHLIRVAQK